MDREKLNESIQRVAWAFEGNIGDIERIYLFCVEIQEFLDNVRPEWEDEFYGESE